MISHSRYGIDSQELMLPESPQLGKTNTYHVMISYNVNISFLSLPELRALWQHE